MLLHSHTPSSPAVSRAIPACNSHRSRTHLNRPRFAPHSTAERASLGLTLPGPLIVSYGAPANRVVVSASSSAKPSAPATAAPPTGGGGGGRDFFESDVVRYGDRYNRPDRFPRLRRADAAQRQVDVRDWLQRLRATARDVFVWDEGENNDALETHGGDSEGAEGAEGAEEGQGAADAAGMAAASAFRLLVAQGRLEEAFDVAREGMRAGRAAFALEPVALLQPGSAGSPAAADHAAFMLAAVDSGNVETAFEYAGLLPPPPCSSSASSAPSASSSSTSLPPSAMAVYNLLLAAYVVAGDSSAMLLAVNTARRRGIAPDGLTSALLLAAAVAHGDEEGGVDKLSQQRLMFEDACAHGHVRPGVTLQQALAACTVPFVRTG
ncbi:hypothetical protein CLOM_g8674 [Closterium sp. NIES-68]|nr:hypothetical protein CLOM_g8674 [Closterium sp. NIES-68]GJP81555.1 hypothetical protein CLOP_g11693 [Closterium sp. NIES-67]